MVGKQIWQDPMRTRHIHYKKDILAKGKKYANEF